MGHMSSLLIIDIYLYMIMYGLLFVEMNCDTLYALGFWTNSHLCMVRHDSRISTRKELSRWYFLFVIHG